MENNTNSIHFLREELEQIDFNGMSTRVGFFYA